MGNWRNGSWQWALHWGRPLYDWEKGNLTELQRLIDEAQPVQGQKDCWNRRHNKDGVYSVKSAYILLSSRNYENKAWIHERVWNRLIPTKVSAFTWQVLQNLIPTKLNLFQRGIITDPSHLMCCLCGESFEDVNHLFLHCKVAYSVWCKCLQWWRISSAQAEKCCEAFEQHFSVFNDPIVRAGWDVIWFSILWAVWTARNSKVFRNHEYDKDRLFDLVQLRAFYWIKGRNSTYSSTLYEWLKEPVLSLKAKGRK